MSRNSLLEAVAKSEGEVTWLWVRIQLQSLMSLRLNDNKLLEKYETVCTKIEYLENIKSDALPVYDDRFIKN